LLDDVSGFVPQRVGQDVVRWERLGKPVKWEGFGKAEK
jgi:hypothetical protein